MDSHRDSMENLVLSNFPKDTQDLCQDHTIPCPFPSCATCLIHPHQAQGTALTTVYLQRMQTIPKVAEAAPTRPCQQHRF